MVAIKRKKRVSKNKRTRILKAVAAGNSVKSVADKHGIHFTTVNKWLRDANIPSPRARAKQIQHPAPKRAYVKKVFAKPNLTKLPDDIKEILLKALSEKYGIDLT